MIFRDALTQAEKIIVVDGCKSLLLKRSGRVQGAVQIMEEILKKN